MLYEQKETQRVLSGIVAHVNGDPAWHDDLMQEGTIHLWQLEAERPGQSRSWYLQSCRYFLHHHMAKGRSVDSWKRQEQRISLFLDAGDDELQSSFGYDWITGATSAIDAQEMLCHLRQHLTTKQQKVLSHLENGLSSREIGLKLGVSHNAVLKHRHKIAATARDLGIAPISL